MTIRMIGDRGRIHENGLPVGNTTWVICVLAEVPLPRLALVWPPLAILTQFLPASCNLGSKTEMSLESNLTVFTSRAVCFQLKDSPISSQVYRCLQTYSPIYKHYKPFCPVLTSELLRVK